MHSQTRHGPRARTPRSRVLAVALLLSALSAGAAAGPAAPARAAAAGPVAAPGAPAAERTVSGGRLDWGVKASFQSYVTGPIAQGRWSLSGGAATAGENLFRFHSAQGRYNPATGAFDASFSGGVRFTGHRERGGGNQLDLTLTRPAVHISGRTGTLYADIRSKAKGTGKVTSASRVPLASLALGKVDMRGGTGPLTLTGVPARLTARGAAAFAGYYRAGTPLDPVSLSADLAARTGGGTAGKKEKKEEKGEGEKKERKHEEGDTGERGRFTGAAVDWGVRRTFREYVTGSVAKGRWKLGDGARDGGALFRFTAGKGSYDPDEGTLDADFRGAVGFTGKRLALRLSAVSVRIADGRGTLRADVTRDGRTTRDQPLVTFPAARSALRPEGGLMRLTEVRTELTSQGAEAFEGMYAEGTRMDPVSLAVPLDEDAELPALPDLGSSPTAAPGSRTKQHGTSATASSDASSLPVVAGGAAVAVLLAAGGAFLAHRRRRARRTGPPD
ncbi:HtaA domain-containing protein [Streptomyces qinglanensis]|uniref:HtaA domain-containing protein n=1 Tax=Streptomyces qinglanensis TaxID=943816 RepID=UPI003D75FF75